MQHMKHNGKISNNTLSLKDYVHLLTIDLNYKRIFLPDIRIRFRRLKKVSVRATSNDDEPCKNNLTVARTL